MIPTQGTLEILTTSSLASGVAVLEKLWEIIYPQIFHAPPDLTLVDVYTLDEIWDLSTIDGMMPVIITNTRTLRRTRRSPYYRDSGHIHPFPAAWIDHPETAPIPVYTIPQCPDGQIYLCTSRWVQKIEYLPPLA